MPVGSVLKDGNHDVAIVALANALLDMSISVNDDSLVEKYGLPIDGQIEVTKEQQKLFNEVVEKYSVEYVAGGSAQNTVRLLCQLIRNQRPCYVVGKIANDRAGSILQNLLAQDGVQTRFVKDPSLATGCCAAIVRRDGQRCLAAHIGAAGHFDLDYLNSVGGLELIDRCRILLVEGFFAHHSPDVAMAALRRADSRGGTVRLLTLSALYICLESHALLSRLLPYANLVVGNEDECRALADRLGINNQQPIASVARHIASHFDSATPLTGMNESDSPNRLVDFQESTVEWSQLKEKLLVVTCGASAAICATRSQTWQYPAVKLSAEQVKDTTGAGDAFLAGFLSQLLDNQPLEVCVARGHQTAALVVTQTGCRLPV